MDYYSDTPRKIFALTFSLQALLYDVSNNAYVEGQTIQTEAEKDRHMVIDIKEGQNRDIITHVMDVAFTECKELLYPYTKIPVTEEGLTDANFVSDDFVMTLNVPETFSETTKELLEKKIHDILVGRALAYWMKLNKNFEAAAYWSEHAESAKDSILETMNLRRGRVRRPLTPFA